MQTRLEYGPPRDDEELTAYGAVVLASFAFPESMTSPLDTCRSFLDRGGQARVVRGAPGSDVAGEVLGGLVRFDTRQWFAGRLVTSSAIAVVTTSTEHRGLGVGGFLMRELVRELHRDGVVLSSLYPATHVFYQRAGYDVAGFQISYRAPPSTFVAGGKPTSRLRPMKDADFEAVERVHHARMADARGPLERNALLWDAALARGRDASPQAARWVVEHEGRVEGYVVTTRKAGARDAEGRVVLAVTDVAALTGRAASRIVAHLGEQRTAAYEVAMAGAPVDPVVHAIAEPRAVAELRTEWLLRVVDVPKALAACGYPRAVSAELHLDVRDELVPENAGRWTLSVKDGAGTVARGGRGDVALDVRALASLYAGHLSPHELRRMDRLAAPDGAVEDAASIFAGPAPWMPDRF